jgi:hypothetical protein
VRIALAPIADERRDKADMEDAVGVVGWRKRLLISGWPCFAEANELRCGRS